jgi:hypothetical protein
MQHIVTIIHGTWAQRSSWTQVNSPLCSAITERLGGEVRFCTFKWSGRNSFSARSDAAELLREHFRRIFSTYPDAHFYAIAHSHGGNVLASALDVNLVQKLNALIFLATPFMIARPRSEARAAFLRFGSIGIIVLIALLFCAFITGSFTEARPPLTNTTVAFLVTCIFVFPLFRVRKWAEASARLIESSLGLGIPPGARVLIVRSVRDEAYYALTALQFASSVIDMFHRFTIQWYVYLPTALTVVAAGAVYMTHRTVPDATFFIVMLLPGALSGVMAVPFIAAISVMAVGLGAEFVFGSLVLDVSVEIAPEGIWPVCQICPDQGHSGLLHGAPYKDKRALAEICDWMRRRA